MKGLLSPGKTETKEPSGVHATAGASYCDANTHVREQVWFLSHICDKVGINALCRSGCHSTSRGIVVNTKDVMQAMVTEQILLGERNTSPLP